MWLRAPPSDHDTKSKVLPSRTTVAGAEIDTSPLAMTVREKGVGSLVLPTDSSMPDGLDANEASNVFGCRTTPALDARPLESVAVTVSRRCDGYSCSGASKLPASVCGNVSMPWSWQPEVEQCSS